MNAAQIEQHQGLVPRLCRSLFPDATPAEREDLESAGLEALCRAAQGHDAATGAKFSTYAYRAVQWAMQTEWKRLQRERARRQASVSLDAPLPGTDAFTVADLLLDEDTDTLTAVLEGERTAALWSALRTLPEKQRRVLLLRYWRNLTFEEIGQALGITNAHQAHAAALVRLKRDKTVRQWR